MTNPSWYLIPEITFNSFIECIKGLYDVLEKKNKSKTFPDVFLKTVLTSFSGLTPDQWEAAETARMFQKALEAKMGFFHQDLMGKFNGYRTFKTGHSTGLDVCNDEKKEYIEVKNKNNTMNSGAGESAVKKLMKICDSGMKAILVQVNCPNGRVSRFKAPASVEVWDGKKAYAHLSGRETFFDELNKTLEYVFANYKTYEQLKTTL
uniref:Restriction endonuclease n=1 Tax=viral metagenome TaxID=1070528 RepID=A0A6C0CET8_9ZZZZ